MNGTHLIIGQRYAMPDRTTGKFIGVHHGTHIDLYCFRLAGAEVVIAKLTESQARGAQPGGRP